MAIRMMTSEENAGNPNVETVDNYPGHETGRAIHAGKCAHDRDDDFARKLGPDCANHWCHISKPLYMETTFEGAVLDTGEMNGRDDSDFYAVVWDEEMGQVRRVEYASTRGWCYPNSATIDATDEVKEKASRWIERSYLRPTLLLSAERKAKEVTKGRRVRVTRGRKVEHGTEGEVFWMGAPTAYSPSRWAVKSTRIGIALDDERDARGRFKNVVWTYAHNVEVIEPKIEYSTLRRIVSNAKQGSTSWRSVGAVAGYAFA
jgi:hypothetical protein